MRNFKKLLIRQKGFQIAVKSIKLVPDFPKEVKYDLSYQITSATVSISCNIAEGSSTSMNDYNRFLEIFPGLTFEPETQLLIAEAVNFGEKEKRDDLLKNIDEEQKMLMSFMSCLKL